MMSRCEIDGDMEESAESSGAEGEIEIVDPFENFLKNTFLPQFSGSGSSEDLTKRTSKSSSVVDVKDLVQTFIQETCHSAPKNGAPLGQNP